ncbi:MAG: hypothetical protein R2856_26855 [Caldilineaceae bacterium]
MGILQVGDRRRPALPHLRRFDEQAGVLARLEQKAERPIVALIVETGASRRSATRKWTSPQRRTDCATRRGDRPDLRPAQGGLNLGVGRIRCERLEQLTSLLLSTPCELTSDA